MNSTRLFRIKLEFGNSLINNQWILLYHSPMGCKVFAPNVNATFVEKKTIHFRKS